MLSRISGVTALAIMIAIAGCNGGGGGGNKGGGQSIAPSTSSITPPTNTPPPGNVPPPPTRRAIEAEAKPGPTNGQAILEWTRPADQPYRARQELTGIATNDQATLLR